MRSVFVAVLLLFSVAGCSTISPNIDPRNALHVRLEDVALDAVQRSYPVTIRLASYTDGRKGVHPRQVGIATEPIIGFVGKELILDSEVATLVWDVMRQQLVQSGLQVVGAEAKTAQFQLAGTIKALSVDVKDRDYLNIVIESTLTEVASGKVIWSGAVVEKRDRYAGVYGNRKEDVADYLRDGLRIVAAKTSKAILSALTSAKPDLLGSDTAMPGDEAKKTHAGAIPPSASVQDVAPALSKTGTLWVATVPTRAKLYIDDVYYGLTPLRIDLPPGIYAVRTELEGYPSVSEKISVRSEALTELEITLHK